jgi:hypothetical protein
MGIAYQKNAPERTAGIFKDSIQRRDIFPYMNL